jgi:2-dehydro-3-deoxygalactonokinase
MTDQTSQTKYFFSCDWGTSAFRLRLIEVNTCKVTAESSSHEGIAVTYSLWQQINNPDKGERTAFYLNVIKRHINEIEQKINIPLSGIKIIISGMASSTIGFIDIPYSLLPLAVDGLNINTSTIYADKNFNHTVLIISGIKTASDVIRGEETQLIGCIDLLKRPVNDELFIFPGTHSKHIHVINNQIVDFKTYMTGEFFELLSQKSILKTTIENHDDIEHPEFIKSFKKGVNDAIDSNLLNAAFKVRTNSLFGLLSEKENFSYLSGLLIATELKDLAKRKAEKISLVCGTNLQAYYLLALQQLGLSDTIQVFPSGWLDDAVIRGHYKIYQQIFIQ